VIINVIDPIGSDSRQNIIQRIGSADYLLRLFTAGIFFQPALIGL
jgi:hypothetical protein